MATGETRKVSTKDLQLVQNLIERCLQLYMSQKEVVNTLLQQAKIEPSFTELVWQKLEEENQDFFKAYHLRLVLKEQIIKFNALLQTQADLMRQICPTEVASIAMSNDSQVQLMHQNSACLAEEHTEPAQSSQNHHPSFGVSLPNAYTNGGSPLQPCMQTAIDTSVQARRNNVSPNMLAHNSNMGMTQGTNGGLIKSEAGYEAYGTDGNILERQPTNGEVPASSFNGLEGNETILDPDISSFGFLGQIPRNFSLSDLTADFSNCSDILGSYSRSPYLATETDDFMNPRGRVGHQGDVKRLDIISKGLSYVVQVNNILPPSHNKRRSYCSARELRKK